jgi:crotonobetainyl-CoA:carnitine CoA-transferase CaiB-like acyl-CoA transferase
VTQRILDGIRVLDLAGEPAALTGRILADLGADVLRAEPPTGDPLRGAVPFAGARRDPDASLRFAAWNAGKSGLACSADDPRLAAALAGAHIVIDTPGWPGVHQIDPSRAPQAVWVHVTPFGASGPRAKWRASDLGVMAASGNMYCTGFIDRAPVRCSEPTGYAHTGPDAAFAALSALASGRPQIVDLSMQESVMVANMGGAVSFPKTGDRGRRGGASVGRSREIWRCQDGYVSFGLRGGAARVPTLELMTKLLVEDGLAAPAWTERDWSEFNPNATSDAEFRALEEPLERYFARHRMGELFAIACETNMMLASANSPVEMVESKQLTHRHFFSKLGEIEKFPTRFALAVSPNDEVEPPAARRPAPHLEDARRAAVPAWPALPVPRSGQRGAWEGAKIVEFGSGAAGPIATRYFAEHGATVVKIESRSRPDFLRVYALGPQNPHGLEGSALFNALNVGKRSITLNLKHKDGVALAKRLMFWADGVLENFAPKAMKGFGLDYATLSAEKPDLVMVSSCLNGQTGPHKDYPGFGGQGSALSGMNFLTGWPDREPVGPYGTITDSLSPRFGATALAAGILYRRRTGKGVHLDVSQVESALFSLSAWLLDYTVNGHVEMRMGNRSLRAAPHGAFPCQGDDRWVAIACWSDAEWARFAELLGVRDASLASSAARLSRVDEVEALVSKWTRERTREAVCGALQAAGIEAVPVQDFGDLHADPQLAHRGHWVELPHPVLGKALYERNGFRLSDAASGYPSATPVLGQHNDSVLRDLLGLSAAECERLVAAAAVETE